MIPETLEKIEAKIRNASIQEERRRELLDLVGKLRTETEELSKTHGDEAESIASFAEVSTHEATRSEKNPHSFDHALQGLSSSVAGFEKSHPKLVQVVNSICTTLSNLGI